jgi:hypothetical protein
MIMSDNLPTKPRSRVTAFLEKASTAARARLAVVIDATGSREPTWDMAVQLQAKMFEEAARVGMGRLEIQLTHFRGLDEVSSTPWMTDARALAQMMSRVRCQTGMTKIKRALARVRAEHQVQPIAAVVFIGDMMEENHGELCDAAAALGIPLFIFQEGDDPDASRTFPEMARLAPKGAHCRFAPGAERQLAELLGAVVAFVKGGERALADLRTDAARLLLTQMKKK